MEEDRDRGIGTISFWSHVYGSDSDSKLAIEYSTDGGSTWMHAGEVTISGSSYREYTAHVGATGKSRVRLRQLSGKRWLLDDFSLTDNSTGVDDPTADRHQWDAYSHSGSLFVNIAEGAEPTSPYTAWTAPHSSRTHDRGAAHLRQPPHRSGIHCRGRRLLAHSPYPII